MARVIRQSELCSLVRDVYHAAKMRPITSLIQKSGTPEQYVQRQGFISSAKTDFNNMWHPVRTPRCLQDFSEPRFHRWFLHRAKGIFFSGIPENAVVVPGNTETVSISSEAGGEVVSVEIETETAGGVNDAVAGSQALDTQTKGEIASVEKVSGAPVTDIPSRINGDAVVPDTSSPLPNAVPMPKLDQGREIQPGRVYIAGLPIGIKGDEMKQILREMCAKHGNVEEITLGQHRHMSRASVTAGKHRGFAFVTMETPEQAWAVIDNLHGATAFDGRTIRASYGLKEKRDTERPRRISRQNSPFRRVAFVGNLHESTTDQRLASHFQHLGTVEQVKVLTELHTGRSRGFGFITFEKEDQALQAVRDKDGSSLDGSSIVVNIAKYPRGY